MRLLHPPQVSGEIMNLLDKARQYVVIVSPYNKIKNWHKLYLQRLRSRKLPVEYYVRKEATPSTGLLEVREAGFTPIEIEGLHCKFYLNEHCGIVTSMNLLLSSDVNALEIGYLTETTREYEELVQFLDDNIRSRVTPAALLLPLSGAPALELLAVSPPATGNLAEVVAEATPIAQDLLASSVEATIDEEETALAYFNRLLGVAPRSTHPHQLQGELSEVLSVSVEVRHYYVQVTYTFAWSVRRKLYQALYTQREELERQVGYPLSWGRDLKRVKVELSLPIMPLVTAWDQAKHRPVTDWSLLEREQLGRQAQHATQVLQQVVADQVIVLTASN